MVAAAMVAACHSHPLCFPCTFLDLGAVVLPTTPTLYAALAALCLPANQLCVNVCRRPRYLSARYRMSLRELRLAMRYC